MKQPNIINILKTVRNDFDNYVNALYRQTRVIEMFKDEQSDTHLCSETKSTLIYAHVADDLQDKLENAIFEIEDILALKKSKKEKSK